MKLWRKLQDFFSFGETNEWYEVGRLPKWAWAYYRRWKSRLSTHPYNLSCYIKGNHMLYKVVHGQGNQGEAPITGIYAKRRSK